MMYVALVKLDHLKGVDDPLHEIAFTDAATEREAVQNLTAMDWPRPYWDSKKSICRIKTIMMVDKKDPFFKRRFADAVGKSMSETSTDTTKHSRKPKRRRQRLKTQLPLPLEQSGRRVRKKKK